MSSFLTKLASLYIVYGALVANIKKNSLYVCILGHYIDSDSDF